MNFFILLIALFSASPILAKPAKIEPKSCYSCRFIVNILHNLYGQQLTEDCLNDAFIYLCKKLSITDNFVCKGIVSDFKDVYEYVLRELIANPNEICGLFFSDCGSVINPFASTWSIPLPANKPQYQPPQLPQVNSPKLRVLHLSDIHFDLKYQPGSEANCNEPLCCRSGNNTYDKSSIKESAGYWGSLFSCDTPYWLAENMMQHIANIHTDLDYAIISGDYESHSVWNYNKPEHQVIIQNVTGLIRRYLPNIPLYFTLGNHEGVPIDCYAPHTVPQKFWMDWLYETIDTIWKPEIPDDQDAAVRFHGSYMKKLYPGLRLIALNNAYGATFNLFLYLNQTDPDGVMSWFVQQLTDAEKAGDKVHVLAHIPGGDTEALEGFSYNYYKAINRFESTVVAQFFGHTHNDQFMVMYENSLDFRSRPTGVLFTAPSVTTYSYINPAYRIYTIDGNYPGSTFRVLDYEGYFFNVTKANANPSNPEWKQLYSAKDEYGLPSLFPLDWNNLIERFKTDDKLLSKYVRNFYRRNGVECDALCKRNMLCSMRKARHENKLCSDIVKEEEEVEKRKAEEITVDPVQIQLELMATRDKCPIAG